MTILPFLFILPTLNYGTYCPWPLEDTTHHEVIMYFPAAALNTTVPCALGCGLEPAVSLFFTPAEQDNLDQVLLMLCILALSVTIIYSINLVLQHQDHPRKFLRADLAYQIPFLINIGYLIFLFTVLFHPGSLAMASEKPAYCNKDEKTLSIGDPANGNERCTVLAIFVFLAIKIISSYTMVLSIVLFLTFWKPWYRNRNCKYIAHGLIFLTITVQTACMLEWNLVQGDLQMKLCLPAINSSTATLWLNLIPMSLYQGIATVLLCSCLWKLYIMTTKKATPRAVETEMSVTGKDPDFSIFSSMSTHSHRTFREIVHIPRLRTRRHSENAEELRGLSHRLLAFNIIQSTCVFVLTFVFIYWFENLSSWEMVAGEVIQCQVETYGLAILMGQGDSDGSLLELAYDCVNTVGKSGPPIWAYQLMHFSFAASAVAGLMLTCSARIMQKYRTGLDSIQRKVTGRTNERPFTPAMNFSGNISESRTFETGFGASSTALSCSKSTPDKLPRTSSKRNSNNDFCEVDSNDEGDAIDMSDRPSSSNSFK